MKDPRRDVPPTLGQEVDDGLQEAVSGLGRSAFWGAAVGLVVGLVGGLVLLGPPGIGIGLLLGIPGGALLGVLVSFTLP